MLPSHPHPPVANPEPTLTPSTTPQNIWHSRANWHPLVRFHPKNQPFHKPELAFSPYSNWHPCQLNHLLSPTRPVALSSNSTAKIRPIRVILSILQHKGHVLAKNPPNPSRRDFLLKPLP